MRCSTLLLAASAASSVLGAPLETRKHYDPLPGGDIDILNYALTLEYLERAFYKEGLSNYTEAQFCAAGLDAHFYKNLMQIYEDEKAHVDFLATALGDKAVKEATYDFPSTDVHSFLALAGILEGVGVSAYLGAAPVIANKVYLTAAGSILTVEARHTAYIRAALGQKPFPKPFDTALYFNQVYSLAAQFITAFAPGTVLPFKAFPPIMVAPFAKNGALPQGGYVEGGCGVVFTGAYKNAMAGELVKEGVHVYAVLFSGLDMYYAMVEASGDDYVLKTLPKGAVGQVYVVLSTADGNATKVSDETTVSGVGVLEIMAHMNTTMKA